MRVRDIPLLFKEAAWEWFGDNVFLLGAALAYYTIFSLAPLLIIVIALAGLVFGQEAAQGEIVEQMRELIGEQGARAIEMLIANARQPATGTIATVASIVLLLVGATGAFVMLQNALNTIWGVQSTQAWSAWSLIKQRFLSFAMVLGIGFLLLVSLTVNAALAALGKYMDGVLPNYQAVFQTANTLISYAIITLLFAMIYKFLPDTDVRWSDVWFGALITALFFTLGKQLIGLYLGRSTVASVYGAAGSFAVLLLWIYYSTLVIFYGAEFTQVYARHRGTWSAKVAAQAKTHPPVAVSIVPVAVRRGKRPPIRGVGTLVKAVAYLALLRWLKKRVGGKG